MTMEMSLNNAAFFLFTNYQKPQVPSVMNHTVRQIVAKDKKTDIE